MSRPRRSLFGRNSDDGRTEAHSGCQEARSLATSDCGMVHARDEPNRTALLVAHAVLMGVAWLLLAPLAVGISRFCRTTCASRSLNWHSRLMLTVAMVTLVGFSVGLVMTRQHFSSVHGRCGLLLVICVLLQPMLGALRPSEEAPGKAKWRAAHKGFGYLMLLLGSFTAVLGAFESDGGAAVVLPVCTVALLSALIGVATEFRQRRRTLSAETAMTQPGPQLPAGWERRVDSVSGATYYWNRSTGETQFLAPPMKAAVIKLDGLSLPRMEKLPPPEAKASNTNPEQPWQQHTDPASGATYWHNQRTGDSTWQKPLGLGRKMQSQSQPQ